MVLLCLFVAVIEFICAFQIVPFGVLCFLPSYKALEKFTSRWQVNYFTFYSDYTHIHFAGLPCLCRLLKLRIFIDVGPFECSPCLRHWRHLHIIWLCAFILRCNLTFGFELWYSSNYSMCWCDVADNSIITGPVNLHSCLSIRRPASADRTARAANFRRDLEAT